MSSVIGRWTLNVGRWTFSRSPLPVRILRGPELLSDKDPRDELTQALGVNLEQPVLRAILQLIETAEDNANRAAADDPAQREKHVGGAEQLRLLRDDILGRRENVFKMRNAERGTRSGQR